MERSGLFVLDRHRRYASFAHEQYQHFFAAWATVRGCRTASDLVTALEMPRNLAIRTFTLGLYAMTQPASALGTIIEELRTTDVLDDCLSGQCGTDLQAAAEELTLSSFERVIPEISELVFVPHSTSFGRVKFGSFSRGWTPAERWAFGILGKRLSRGDHINELLDLAELMDMRLESESRRLASAHEEPKNFFGDVFAMVYVFSHPQAPGFTSIVSALRMASIKSIDKQTAPQPFDILESLRSHRRLTRGQIYLLLELTKHWSWDGSLLEIMPDLIPDVWQKGPYHLRLQLMEVLQMASGYSDDEILKNELANVLQELYSRDPFVNSIITDALTSLIELESSQTEEEYCEAIRRLLDIPDDTMAQDLAYGYYISQFDHPTDASEVYSAIDSLNAEEKGNFLVMAGKAMKDYSFFADVLLNELCTLLPPKAELVFRKYCHPPDPQDTFFQDAVARFLLSAVGLARLRAELPQHDPQSGISDTWWAVGEIFYWMNIENENSEKKASAIEALWDRLTTQVHSWPVVSFVLTDSLIRTRNRKFQMDLLPEFLTKIKLLATQELMSFQSRHEENDNAQDVLRKPFRDPISSAIAIFGSYGGAEDKKMLMRLVDDPEYGEEIVRALRNIRERDDGTGT
jgi:hypothetical protein